MRTQSKTNQTHGNTRITKSSSVLVLHLIGRESCVSFLDQLRSQVKPKQTNPGFYPPSAQLKIALTDYLTVTN